MGNGYVVLRRALSAVEMTDVLDWTAAGERAVVEAVDLLPGMAQDAVRGGHGTLVVLATEAHAVRFFEQWANPATDYWGGSGGGA